MPNAYPLQWPIGRNRWTGSHPSAAFKVTEAKAADELFDNLELMGASNILVSSNRQPYGRSRANPEDPGVAVYFTRKGQELCIACDKWDRLEHNLRAVGLTVEGMRAAERWGTEQMADAQFTGFAALPESIEMGPGQAQAWYDVLEVSQNASPEVIKAAYKTKIKAAHPDQGGSQEQFQKVQNALKESGI